MERKFQKEFFNIKKFFLGGKNDLVEINNPY